MKSATAIVSLFASAIILSAQSPITFQYFYDDINQLVRVVDSTGVVIEYVYDPVGNILQIKRSTVAPGALAVFGVSAQTAVTGGTITVQGQGFSANPALDIVTIGGVAATVLSATNTTLVVMIPPNGMSGPISVTVGSATATSDFTETIIPAPNISSVKPYAAQAGTTVTLTVTGQNLLGSTFAFAPSGSGLVVSFATISSNGTSASLTAVAGANANGRFALVATNGGANSGLTLTKANAFGVFIDPNADADNDGLANAFELLLGTDPFNPDTDGDGFSDGVEVASGSDPLNPACTPLNCRLSGEGDGVVFSALYSVPALDSSRIEADSTAFSLLNVHLPVSSLSEADSTVFSLLNVQMPASFLSETDSTPFSLCNSLDSCSNYSPLLPALRHPPVQTSGFDRGQVAGGTPAGSGVRAPKRLSVVSVTPAQGVAHIALDSIVTLVFSTPLDPASINAQNFRLLAGPRRLDARREQEELNGEIRYSSDFRNVMLHAALPANALVTIRATSGVQDIWGRRLDAFQSEFSTAAAPEEMPSLVMAQKPPVGAGGVPVHAKIQLFLGRALDPGTSPIPIQVTQDGEAIAGEARLASDGTRVEFVPAQPYRPDATIRVSMDEVRDQGGAPLAGYEGAFRALAGPEDFAEPLRAVPGYSVEAPVSPVVEVEYSRPIVPASVNGSTATLRETATGRLIAATVRLRGDRIVRIEPAETLKAASSYTYELSSDLLDVTGQPGESFQQAFVTSEDTRAATPAMAFSIPEEGATITEYSEFRLRFDAPINPLTLDERTAGVTEDGASVPLAISFAKGGSEVILTPLRALKNSALILVTISGVEDLRGNPIAARTAGFRVQPGSSARPSEFRKQASVGSTGNPQRRR